MDIKFLLEKNYLRFNRLSFIADDPVSIPHRFFRKEDIEIAGLLAALLAWGNRNSILKSANRLLDMTGDSPYEFIVNSAPEDLIPFRRFVHRTFQGEDCVFLMNSLQHIYRNKGGLEELFRIAQHEGVKIAIMNFRKAVLEAPHSPRSEKHFANPDAGSAAKRINMFLRWMVRKDDIGVDFGIWRSIDPAQLICPLDVHSARTARRLGLLTRKTNDWKAAEELTGRLRRFDPADPVKYDFALFGIGVYGKHSRNSIPD